MDKAEHKMGFSRWAHNAADGLRQIGGMIVSFPSTFASARASDKILLAGFAATGVIVTGGALAIAGPVMAALQALGFVAGGLSMLNQRLQHNHTKLAVQPLVSGGLAVQTALLGGFGYAIMAGIAGVRSWIFSMLPEDKKFGGLRTGIAVGFAAVGMAGITALSFLTGRFENLITVPSMLLGTVADRVPSSNDPAKDHTRYARLFRMAANANNTVFNAVISHSWAGAFMDSIATANLQNAIRTYDVPVRHEDGKRMNVVESLSSYFNSLVKSAPPKGLTPHLLQTAEQQPPSP